MRKPALFSSGFTLVELLVVITIVAILVALLLPAVQAAREAARQVQCRNHVKQLALGCLSHENATGRFPTGGWGFAWTGDADRGTGCAQPGGWIYNILPYVEQEPLHDLGLGLPTAQKNAAHLRRMTVPLSILHCPSRRNAVVYPWTSSSAGGLPVVNAGMPTAVGRNDYAINAGDNAVITHVFGYPVDTPAWNSCPAGAEGGPASFSEVENPPGQMTPAARTTFTAIAGVATGIAYVGSLVRMADVTDGTSQTYLLGEKYLDPDNYFDGLDEGDNEEAMMGFNDDIARWSGGPAGSRMAWSADDACPPLPDTPGITGLGLYFGSEHANGFQTAFCDGSVHTISYAIDPMVHRCLCNRHDGQAIDGKKL